MICLNDAIIIDPQQIQDAFYKFYSHLFYIKMDNKKRTHLGIAQSGPRIDQRQQNLLNLSFSNTEIKDAIWSIPDGKASKLDGFNIKFYKAYWEIVGPDVIAAVQDLFSTGKLLKAWNITSITLVPKVHFPSFPSDIRPILCCPVLYKCISKLICTWLKLVLRSLIDQAQGASVQSLASCLLLFSFEFDC